jgi:hypothetical protein
VTPKSPKPLKNKENPEISTTSGFLFYGAGGGTRTYTARSKSIEISAFFECL